MIRDSVKSLFFVYGNLDPGAFLKHIGWECTYFVGVAGYGKTCWGQFLEILWWWVLMDMQTKPLSTRCVSIIIKVCFLGKFSILGFSHAFPITSFSEKTLVRSRKNHRFNLHWESTNLAIWVLSSIRQNLFSLLWVSIGFHYPYPRTDPLVS